MNHVRKESVITLTQSTDRETGKVVADGTPRGSDTATASPDREIPSRKAYYESWDKFDVDHALEEIEKDSAKPPTVLPSVGSVETTTHAPVSVTNTSPRSATPLSKKTAPQSKAPDPVVAANAEKEKVSDWPPQHSFI